MEQGVEVLVTPLEAKLPRLSDQIRSSRYLCVEKSHISSETLAYLQNSCLQWPTPRPQLKLSTKWADPQADPTLIYHEPGIPMGGKVQWLRATQGDTSDFVTPWNRMPWERWTERGLGILEQTRSCKIPNGGAQNCRMLLLITNHRYFQNQGCMKCGSTHPLDWGTQPKCKLHRFWPSGSLIIPVAGWDFSSWSWQRVSHSSWGPRTDRSNMPVNLGKWTSSIASLSSMQLACSCRVLCSGWLMILVSPG